MAAERLLAHPYCDVGRNPEIFPYHVDLASDRLVLAIIPVEAQAEATFLDERVLTPQTKMEWVDWAEFERAVAPVRHRAPSYILHLGHSGSTLLAKLVERASGVRTLREPLALRTLALDAAHGLDGCAMLSRRARINRLQALEKAWCCQAPTVIKATSMVNDMIDDISADSAVAFLHLTPETYIAALLATPQRQIDLRNFGQMRLRRWNYRSGRPQNMTELSPGELAALCWLVETSSIAASQRRIFDINFDDFLAAPAERLRKVCQQFGLSADRENCERITNSEFMNRHAKATRMEYNADIRAQMLGESRRTQAAEISRGMRWLENSAQNFMAGERAMQLFS